MRTFGHDEALQSDFRRVLETFHASEYNRKDQKPKYEMRRQSVGQKQLGKGFASIIRAFQTVQQTTTFFISHDVAATQYQ